MNTVRLVRLCAVIVIVGVVYGGLNASIQAALIGYWNFDETSGSLAGSAAVAPGAGTLQGGPLRTAGRFGGAVQFDGANDQVIVANAASLFSTMANQATLSLWAYGDAALPLSRTIFSAKNASGGRVLQSHLPWSDGVVYWDAGNSYDRIQKQATTPDIKGQWNHWVFTKDATAGVMKVYLNGQLWQITAPSGTSSAALNKPATQSSSPYYPSGTADKAVDGNTDGNWGGGSVTHTNSESQAWWQVDLGAMTPIYDLVLWNRTDCCWDRLSNFHVSVLDAGMNEVFRRDLFTAVTNPSADRVPVNVGGIAGQYIRVQLNGTNPLSLAEVVVNGTPQTPQTLPMSGITSFAIGSANGAEYWPGLIDDVAVWDHVLSDAQIAALASHAVTISEPTIANSITNTGGALNPGGEGVIGTTQFASGNLALQTMGATATQSTTAYGGAASRANDGNTDGNYWNNSVTHTDFEAQAWWQVDLGTTATLDSLTLWNRTDCCGDRLSNFHVSVRDDSMAELWGQDYFTGGGYPNPSLSIVLPDGTRGRFVRVQLNGTNMLSLAEMQATGGYDYTQGGDGVLRIDLDAASGTADKLIVGGTLTLGGTLEVNLLTGEPDIGATFDIMDWGDLVGTFDALNLPPFSTPAVFWDTSRLYLDGVLSVGVPEPGTVVLLALGLLGVGVRRRRKHR